MAVFVMYAGDGGDLSQSRRLSNDEGRNCPETLRAVVGAEEWDSRNLRFSHFEQSPMLQHQWPYAGSELYVANLLGPRGNGIGSALLRSAGQEAIRRGAYRRSSLPAPSKPPEFYERLGCARQVTIPNYP